MMTEQISVTILWLRKIFVVLLIIKWFGRNDAMNVQYMESMQAWHGWWILKTCGKKMLPSRRCSLVLGLTDKWGPSVGWKAGQSDVLASIYYPLQGFPVSTNTTSLGQRVSLSEQLSLYKPHEAPVGKSFCAEFVD